MPARKLKVYRRIEGLLHRIYPAVTNFPKAEKYALSQELKNQFYQLLSNIALGNSVKSKRRTYLQIADGHLQTIKVLIKLANNRRYIGKGFYREIDEELTEIDHMLSAYIKAS